MNPATSLSHKLHSCPRCGSAFSCQPGAEADCVCFQFNLPTEVTRYLRINYESCVCPDCLHELIHAAENNIGVFFKPAVL